MLVLQGELNQQRGLVPSNFLEAVPLDGDTAEEFHSKDKEASPLSAESQVRCVAAWHCHPGGDVSGAWALHGMQHPWDH